MYANGVIYAPPTHSVVPGRREAASPATEHVHEIVSGSPFQAQLHQVRCSGFSKPAACDVRDDIYGIYAGRVIYAGSACPRARFRKIIGVFVSVKIVIYGIYGIYGAESFRTAEGAP